MVKENIDNLKNFEDVSSARGALESFHYTTIQLRWHSEENISNNLKIIREVYPIIAVIKAK